MFPKKEKLGDKSPGYKAAELGNSSRKDEMRSRKKPLAAAIQDKSTTQLGARTPPQTMKPTTWAILKIPLVDCD